MMRRRRNANPSAAPVNFLLPRLGRAVRLPEIVHNHTSGHCDNEAMTRGESVARVLQGCPGHSPTRPNRSTRSAEPGRTRSCTRCAILDQRRAGCAGTTLRQRYG